MLLSPGARRARSTAHALLVLVLSSSLGACSSSSDSGGGAAVDSRPPLLAPETGWTRIASVPYTGQLNAGVGFEFDDLAVDQGSLAVVYAEQYIQIERPVPVTTAIKKATIALASRSAPSITTLHFDAKDPNALLQGTVRAHFVNGLAAQLTQSIPLRERAASELTEIDEAGTKVTTVAVPDIVNANVTYASNGAIAMGNAYLTGAQGYAGLFAYTPSQGWSELPATLENYDPGFSAPLPNTLTVGVGGLLPFFASDLTPRAAALLSDGRFVVLKPDFTARGFQTELSFALPQYAYHYEDLRNTVYAHIAGYGKSGNVHSFLVGEHAYDSGAPATVSLYRWTEGASSLEKVYSVPESLSTHGDIQTEKSKGHTHVFEIDADGRAHSKLGNTMSESREVSKDGDALLSKTGALTLAIGTAPAYLSHVYVSDGVRYVVAYTFTHPNTGAEDLRFEIYRYEP